jgi:hypothetical protein
MAPYLNNKPARVDRPVVILVDVGGHYFLK